MCTPSLHLSCPKWQYAHVARLTLYIICTCAHAALDLSQDTQRSLYQNSTANRCEQKMQALNRLGPWSWSYPNLQNGHNRKICMLKSHLSRCRVPLTTSRWQQGKVVGQWKDEWFQSCRGSNLQTENFWASEGKVAYWLFKLSSLHDWITRQ